MKQLTLIAGLVVAALLAGTAIVVGGDMARTSSASDPQGKAPGSGVGLPWQIDTQPDGSSRVMGLSLGSEAQSSTLADVRRLWGPDVQIAIIAAPGENGSLEAFVDPAQAGFVSGKMVVSARLPAEVIRGMRERAVKVDFMESTTRKHTLQPEDEQAALAAPLTAVSFIPAARLDAEAIVARFGQPARRIQSNGHLEHFLYPDKGLDVVLDSDGKELLQYVAPAEFKRVQAPLEAALAASQATAPAAQAAQVTEPLSASAPKP